MFILLEGLGTHTKKSRSQEEPEVFESIAVILCDTVLSATYTA